MYSQRERRPLNNDDDDSEGESSEEHEDTGYLCNILAGRSDIVTEPQHDTGLELDKHKSQHVDEEGCDMHKLLKIWPFVYFSLLWLGVMPRSKEWSSASRLLYFLYSVVVFFVALCIGLPYFWYQTAWFHKDLGTINRVMISLHAASPSVVWVLLWKYLRSQHFKYTLLPLFSRYHVTKKMKEVQAYAATWHVFWTITFVFVYWYFTWFSIKKVWPSWGSEGLYGAVKRTVTLLLPLTFVYRTFVPLATITLFQMVMQLHREVIYTWSSDCNSDPDGVDISSVNADLIRAVSWRWATQEEWWDKFFFLMVVPFIELLLFVYSTWLEVEDIRENFLEIFYLCFCIRNALLILGAASSLTTDAYGVRFQLLDDMVMGKSKLKGTSVQHEAFMHKIMHGSSGFSIFGFEISKTAVVNTGRVLAVVLTPVVIKGVKELEQYIGIEVFHVVSANTNSTTL